MIGLAFKRLGLSREEVEAQSRAGIRLKGRVAKTWIAMHETPDPKEGEIVDFEAMAGRLPQDFREFLKNHNGGIPNLSLLKTKNNKRVVEAFLAMKAPKGFSESIVHAVAVYGRRIPRATIPIASAGGGDLLLLNLDSDRFGEILYWDHNLESNEEDASDYFENTELVASSFSNLLERLAFGRG